MEHPSWRIQSVRVTPPYSCLEPWREWASFFLCKRGAIPGEQKLLNKFWAKYGLLVISETFCIQLKWILEKTIADWLIILHITIFPRRRISFLQNKWHSIERYPQHSDDFQGDWLFSYRAFIVFPSKKVVVSLGPAYIEDTMSVNLVERTCLARHSWRQFEIRTTLLCLSREFYSLYCTANDKWPSCFKSACMQSCSSGWRPES